MKKTAVVLIFIFLLGSIFTGCNFIKKVEKNPSSTQEDLGFDLSTPESTIEIYLNDQVALGDSDFQKLFYNQTINEALRNNLVKSAYKMKLLQLDKVIKKVQKGNLAVVVCLYKCKYSQIKDWYYAINSYQMIKKDNSWLILNDSSKLSASDKKWVDDTANNELEKASKDKAYKYVTTAQEKYYKQNSKFFTEAEETLTSAIEQNADKLKEVQ